MDPHVHLMTAGLMLREADLSASTSRTAAVQAVREAWERQKKEPGADSSGWVLGGGWDELKWGGALPDRGWLDEVGGPG